MLKHKDRRAMNLNDFVVLPNGAAKSVKLNARNLQQLRTETESLAQEGDDMEEHLRRLKERMSQEKEERTLPNGFRWKSGQQGLVKNASLINCKKINDSRLQKLSAGKVKMLKEKLPTVQPSPPPPAPEGTKTIQRNNRKGSACGQCEARTAGVKCAECSEDYCMSCFSRLHQKGALKFHSAVRIQTEPQTHVSTQDVVSCLPTQPNPSTNPATFSSPNPRPNPTHTRRGVSDTFTDQRPGNAAAARHMQIQDNSSQILIVQHEDNDKAEHESSLLNGSYNEQESAKSFQEAVRQWREAGPVQAQELMWTPPRTVSDVPTQADLSPGPGAAGGRVPVRVDFAEHGLTLLDRLLLKKHRRTPMALSPLLTDAHVKPLPQSLEKEPEPALTAEDEDVHSYLTSLFAAPTKSQRTGLENSAPEVCFSIEVLDEEDKAVEAETKSLVNRILPLPQAVRAKSSILSSHSFNAATLSIKSTTTSQTKTSLAPGPDLSATPEPATGTQGNRGASIKTASSKPRKPTLRSHTSLGSQAKSRGSPPSPLLSSSAPLYRQTHNAPVSCPPSESPSTGRSSVFKKSDSYPNIPPVLRSTFTVTPSGSFESALLPKVSENSSGRGRNWSPRQFQQSLLEDVVQAHHQFPVSSRNSYTSAPMSVGLSLSGSMQNRISRRRFSLDGSHGVDMKLEHEATGQGLLSKQHKQRFDPSLNNVPTVRSDTGYAKESTFALIQEYHNALKSIQDSDDEMSSDSLDLARCDEDCTDEDADDCLDSGRSRDDRGNPASVHLDEDFVPAHKERERDLPTDGAQQLSEPARVPWLWFDSDDSSDDYPHGNLHLKNSDALHQSRTSLDTSAPAELSQAAMLGLGGCEDPDMEADMTNHTMSRLERELRLLASETGPEVFAAAPGNSSAQHPRGSRLYTRSHTPFNKEWPAPYTILTSD